MPVILTTEEEREAWMNAPLPDALALQRPLPVCRLVVVARGEKQDPPKGPERRAEGLLL